ncbi:phosphate/phosphite/phosphonate ABC transporter substrate-binding protein [Thermomonas sp.]|uniref:phosphate/phosphite/phosphonate ABC transporter substrate-binding protein n=1 Tax=Thermomonas sp. TaxID=1971895 RepID=UPI001AD21778|nr:phosphate/phosphite/phosphonate ABC transporter substrate-binding protein [Xanthomonadales bacterium]MBN8768141.1 phosphate/phosphite/phosphonate ABC transporter substrate-binding protein [Stenotrophomonas sp.]
MRRLAFALLCLCCLLPAGLPSAAAPVVAPESDDGVLVLGRVSDDPKSHYDQLKPLLDYVIPRMASVGIRSGRILMAKDLQQMTSYLRRGRVDWINETAGNAALLEQRGVAHAFLITERDGAQRYHSVFFVRRDSPIQSLQDLVGHSIAFQSPYSTSAYYLPAATLLAQGQSLELLLSPMDKPAPDRVGYVFARTELNITTWVHKRLVDAGVLSNLDWLNPARMPPAFAQDFRVIGRTEDVPRALMLARTGLDPKVEARLNEVLQEAAQDPEAGEALRRFLGTARLLPIGTEDRRSLEWLGRGVRRVRAEVE